MNVQTAGKKSGKEDDEEREKASTLSSIMTMMSRLAPTLTSSMKYESSKSRSKMQEPVSKPSSKRQRSTSAQCHHPPPTFAILPMRSRAGGPWNSALRLHRLICTHRLFARICGSGQYVQQVRIRLVRVDDQWPQRCLVRHRGATKLHHHADRTFQPGMPHSPALRICIRRKGVVQVPSQCQDRPCRYAR